MVWTHERCGGCVDFDLCLFVDWGTVASFWLNFMRFFWLEKLLQVLCVKKILLSDEFADSIYSMRVLRLWFVKEQKNLHLGLRLG